MEEMGKDCQACVHTCRCIFFRETAYLECYLDEGARDEAREDYRAQSVVKEGFQVPLSWCFSC